MSEQENPQNDILMPLLLREHENSESQAVTRGVEGWGAGWGRILYEYADQIDFEVNGTWVDYGCVPLRWWQASRASSKATRNTRAACDLVRWSSAGSTQVNLKKKNSGYTHGWSEEPRAAQTLPAGHFPKNLCNFRWFMDNWKADKNIRVYLNRWRSKGDEFKVGSTWRARSFTSLFM